MCWKTSQKMEPEKPKVTAMSILSSMVSRFETISRQTQLTRKFLAEAFGRSACQSFLGLSDFLQSQRYGPSNYNQQPSNDRSGQEINEKITKEGFSLTVALSFYSIHELLFAQLTGQASLSANSDVLGQ